MSRDSSAACGGPSDHSLNVVVPSRGGHADSVRSLRQALQRVSLDSHCVTSDCCPGCRSIMVGLVASGMKRFGRVACGEFRDVLIDFMRDLHNSDVCKERCRPYLSQVCEGVLKNGYFGPMFSAHLQEVVGEVAAREAELVASVAAVNEEKEKRLNEAGKQLAALNEELMTEKMKRGAVCVELDSVRRQLASRDVDARSAWVRYDLEAKALKAKVKALEDELDDLRPKTPMEDGEEVGNEEGTDYNSDEPPAVTRRPASKQSFPFVLCCMVVALLSIAMALSLRMPSLLELPMPWLSELPMPWKGGNEVQRRGY